MNADRRAGRTAREQGIGRIVVIGTGLIGTSVALAMRGRGAEVLLADRDGASLELAARLGAGSPLPPDGPGEPADLAVLAVPPAAVAPVLLDAQKRGLARVYTDVASVKALPLAAAAELGCDLRTFVAAHPLAGSERSGPAAARADLFLGRTWAVCPAAQTDPAAVALVEELARACGAAPLRVEAAEHDRAVALVSHAPHVVSAATAARLRGADEVALGLAGQGVRDVTRIAAGDPELWIGILAANAGPVADVLEEVATDLALAAALLRDGGEGAMEHVRELLSRGNAGRARIPGKHGGRQSRYAVVPVVVQDRPGELALLFQAAGVAGVNIEDVAIEHSPGMPVGVVELSVEPAAAGRLADELRARGWSVPG
ncbi:prephenate dehydrogenase [Thermomonospora cellulosilytica]|uniref:Prephenate dehydrogenase n=1 Tax=Thermomonospora cellulosilytica TaxID=1411118 RepID=A0A7W3N2K3_9ACTN|nr:prephenate dehydrogenase [Thermomonospora cellulosilytica]MBA9006396.1 prephenate dehydrogenase [Thermomonospora cellulosilytica]